MNHCQNCPLNDHQDTRCPSSWDWPGFCEAIEVESIDPRRGRYWTDKLLSMSADISESKTEKTKPPCDWKKIPTRTIGKKIRCGILGPVLNDGGAETMQLALARYSDSSRIEWVGCVASEGDSQVSPTMKAATELLMPVSWGIDAAKELLSSCDVIITWAILELPDMMIGFVERPWIISVCHSPIESDWGIKAYANTNADCFVAVSELAVPVIPKESRDSTVVIWNAVDLDRLKVRRDRIAMRSLWGIPNDAKIAGYVGRLSDDKDPDAMARTLPHLPNNWHAVIVGSGYERANLEASRSRLGPAADRFHLVGSDSACGDVVNAFDVLVAPSEYESFGLTIAEGIVFGLPVVSTDCGIVKLARELQLPGRPPTTLVPVKADGLTLARAVQEAAQWVDDGGAKVRDGLLPRLMPERFGCEWTELIIEVAGNKPDSSRPSLFSMGVSFGKAIIAHALDDGRKASAAVVAAREASCFSCPSNHDRAKDACLACGCGVLGAASFIGLDLRLKRSWASERCPLAAPRWVAEP